MAADDFHDPDGIESAPRCPACAAAIDYCHGHGEIGDPEGFRVLVAHDLDDHRRCHEAGCSEATPWAALGED